MALGRVQSPSLERPEAWGVQSALVEAVAPQAFLGGFRLCAVQSPWKRTHLTCPNPNVFPCYGNQSGSAKYVANVFCFGFFDWILALHFRMLFDQILCVCVECMYVACT